MLQAEVFRAFKVDPPIPGFDVSMLHQHSLFVARLAVELVGRQPGRDEAFTAGLLHDVGLLVLASQSRGELAEVLSEARTSGRHVFEIELDRFGATHAEFGAQLLSLWGLPATVTEPVARHHTGRLQQRPVAERRCPVRRQHPDRGDRGDGLTRRAAAAHVRC